MNILQSENMETLKEIVSQVYITKTNRVSGREGFSIVTKRPRNRTFRLRLLLLRTLTHLLRSYGDGDKCCNDNER